MAITEEERNAIKQEVDDAMERTTIDKSNLDVYFKTSNKGKVVAWTPLMCKKCGKPLYVHEDPECGIRVRMAKAKAVLYISAITNNESIKQEMEWAILEAGIVPSFDKFEKEIDFPKWQEGWSWETYKRDIKYYMEATTRKPVNQIMDMNQALKDSNQGKIAARMMSEMENFKHDDNIIEKCVKWISATYGMTKYEEQ